MEYGDHLTMAEDLDKNAALSVPLSSDGGVLEAKIKLELLFSFGIYRDDHSTGYDENIPELGLRIEDSLREVSVYLHIAASISALNADHLIKLQDCQFDAIKLCDAWSLMLTSYRIGASDILEKLHVAYLKLLEGFPHSAQQDVAAVSKQVSGMIKAAQNAAEVFSAVRQKIRAASESFDCDNKDESSIRQKMKSDVTEELMQKYFHSEEKEKQKHRSQIIEDFLFDLDNLSNDRQRNIICLVAKESLRLALMTIEKAEVPICEAEHLTRNWYTECVDVVEIAIVQNVAEAAKLSADEQSKFWEELPFVQQAFSFLCRWKALYELCSSHLSMMRPIRQEADILYTENLLPRQSVEKAWRLVRQNSKLNHFKRLSVLPRSERIVTIGKERFSLDNLLKEAINPNAAMISELREVTFQHEDNKNFMERVKRLGHCLTALGYLLPDPPDDLNKFRSIFCRFCKLLHDVITAFESEAADLLIQFQIACNCWVRGLDGLVEEDLAPKLLGTDQIDVLTQVLSKLELPTIGRPPESLEREDRPQVDLSQTDEPGHEHEEEGHLKDLPRTDGPNLAEHGKTDNLKNTAQMDSSTDSDNDQSAAYLSLSHIWDACRALLPRSQRTVTEENNHRFDLSQKIVTLMERDLPFSDIVRKYDNLVRVVLEPVWEFTNPKYAPKPTGGEESDDVAARDWRIEAIKCFQRIQAFRFLCQEQLTDSAWLKDLDSPRPKDKWKACLLATKELGEQDLTTLLVESIEETKERKNNRIRTSGRGAIKVQPLKTDLSSSDVQRERMPTQHATTSQKPEASVADESLFLLRIQNRVL